MKHRQNNIKIKIGKPRSYSFVRGTSVERAIDFLVKAEIEMENPQYLDENIFHVYAHPGFPKNYGFSGDFRAKNERDNLLPARYFAQRHAFNDYLSNVFSGIVSSTAEGFVDFEKYGPKLFYNVFSDDLQDADYTFRKVEDEFIRARRYNGVLLYFNELLAENDIYPDRNEKQRSRFNSVKIYSDNPIRLECLKAIEPLGLYDKIEMKYVAGKLN